MERAHLLTWLTGIILSGRPRRIGITGVDTAGKTTLADELAGRLVERGQPVIRASLDGFHNPLAIRRRLGETAPEAYYTDGFNLPALFSALLDPLGPNGSRLIQTAVYDRETESPLANAPVAAAEDALLIFDGVFLLRPELAGVWDLALFLDITFETVLRRAVARDQSLFGSPQQVIDRYNQKYIPAQRGYLLACRPVDRADIVIGNDDPRHPEIRSIRGGKYEYPAWDS